VRARGERRGSCRALGERETHVDGFLFSLPCSHRFTPEDYHVVTRRKEEEVLMTKSMREAAVAKRASVRTLCSQRCRTHSTRSALSCQEFSRALVRVEFPDGLVLEAAFSPLEPLQALRALVCACVEPSLAAAVYLFTAPPKQKMVRVMRRPHGNAPVMPLSG